MTNDFLVMEELDDDMELETDGEVLWMHDNTDYSHPAFFCLYLKDVPKLIKYLQEFYNENYKESLNG